MKTLSHIPVPLTYITFALHICGEQIVLQSNQINTFILLIIYIVIT